MNKRVGRYIRRKFHKKRWQQFAFMMACIVVFCTTYALLLPAVTLEKTADCNLEEHQHEKSCYENQLICGNKESDGHRHTDSCYQKVLVCGKEVHVHSEDCFHGRILKGTADENISADNTAEEAGQLLLDETEDIEQTAVNEPASGAAMNQEIDPEAEGEGLSFGEEAAAESESVTEHSTAEEAAEEANPLLEETDTAGWEAEISEEQPADGEAVGEAETDSEENAGEEIVGAAETEPEEPSGEETGVAETEPEEPSGGETVEAETESEEPSGEEIGAAEETPSSEPGLTEEQSAEDETAGETETFPEETANVETDQGSETLPEETSDEGTEPVEENPEWAAETSEDQSLTEDTATESETLSEETTNEETRPDEENSEGEAEIIEEQSSAEETAVEIETLSEETAPEEIPNKEAGTTTEQVTSDIVTEDGTAPAQEAAVQLACQGPDYEVTVTSGAKEGIPKDASLSVSEIMPKTPADNTDADYNADTELTYEEYVSRTEEALGIEKDSGYYIRLFDIKIVDAYGEKIKIQAPVNVKIRLTDQKGADISNAQVVHFADETKEADIAEETNGTEKTESETLSESAAKSATITSRNAESAGKAKKIKKAVKAEKEKKDKKGDVIQDVTVEAGVLPEDGTTLSFETEGFSVFAIVGTTIEKTVLASDGKNYKVTVTYGPETGIPLDADLSVEEILPEEKGDTNTFSAYEEYVSKTENALGMEEGSAGYIRLFDIKIVDQDDHNMKYQPKEGTVVDVRIELADSDRERLSVVHFADDAVEGNKIDAETDGKIVSFEANGFSIYAIVDKDDPQSVARAKIVFQNADGTPFEFLNNAGNTVNNQIIRTGSVLEEVGMPAIDVNGQNFQGWYIYDIDNNAYTSYQLKFGGTNTWTVNYGDAKSITSNTAVVTSENTDDNGCVFYARPYFGEVSYLTFYNESAGDNEALGGHSIILNRIQIIDGTTYDISEQQATPPDSIWNENTQTWEPVSYVFTGWSNTSGTDDDDRTAITNTIITVTDDQSFYPTFKQGHWVTFDSAPTGSGATYIPAKIVLSTQTTSVARPTVTPTWKGHTFVGWFTTPENYDPDNANYYNANGTINPTYNGYFSTNESAAGAYSFNQSLEEDLTLYAHWNVDTANVTVVKWQQVVTDDKNASTPTREQMAAEGYASDSSLKHYEYAGQQNLDETVNSILRNNDSDITVPTGFNLNSTLSDAQVVVKDDGTAVLNLYYDRNLITLNFDRDVETHTKTDATTGTLYGLVDGEYVRVTWNGTNWVYTTTEQVTEYVDYTGTRYNTTTGDNGTQYGVYQGTVVRVYHHVGGYGWSAYDHWSRRQTHQGGLFADDQQYDGTRYVQNNNGAYGFVNDSMVRLTNGQYQTTTTQTVEHIYEGDRFTQGTTRSFTGLYGQTLAQNGYEWPSSIGWEYQGYNKNNNGTWSGPSTYQMSYLGQFVVPSNRFNGANDTVTTMNFSSHSASSTIYYYVQNADGSWPGEGGYIDAGVTTAGNIQIAEKFDGFTMDAYEYNNNGHGAEYTANNASWTSVSPGESSKTVRDGMAIRYRRLSYTVKFLDSHDGSELSDVDNVQVMYGASISTAYPGDDVTITNANTQYVWDGKWYKDQACTEAFNFNDAMPNHDVAVYAGWKEVWYWVKIDPNGGVLPSTEATWFWEPYGGTVEEYHNITRGFVEDEDGAYYYHVDVLDPDTELNQYGTNVRKAEYRLISENPNWEQDSIDGKRYSVDADNTYSMVGWYKVNDDGTLELYNFSSPVTENLTLRALWRVVGEYHVKYSVEGVDFNGDPMHTMDEEGNPTTDRLLGTNAPSDTNKYADKSSSSIKGAPNPPSGYTFVGWYYNGHVYNPGDTFILDADLADDNKDVWIYPVYLSIEDQPVETTHIPFIGNGGTTTKTDGSDESWAWEVSDEQTKINYVNVQPNVTFNLEESPTYFTRPGYNFVGWGKRTEGQTTTANNFLEYKNGKFYLVGKTTEAASIAADEFRAYEELYALWEPKTYSVTVVKEVTSAVAGDNEIPFTFTPSFTGMSGTEYQTNFSLVGKESGASVTYLDEGDHEVTIAYDHSKTYNDIPYGTTFSFTEGSYDNFDLTSVKYTVTDADDTTKNVTDQSSSNGTPITVDGNVTVTFTNAPKNGTLSINKVTDPVEIADNDKIFQVTVQNSEGKYLQSASDISFGDSAPETPLFVPINGGLTINNLPADTYTVSELIGTGDDDISLVEINGYRYDGNEIVYTVENETIDSGTVSANATTTATITNSYTKLVDVTVTKMLVDSTSTGTKDFTFTATLTEGEDDISDYLGTIEEGRTEYSFSLSPSNDTSEHAVVRKVFTDIPVGALLTVTETDDSDYTTTVSVGGKETTVDTEGKLTVSDTNNTIDFTNTRKITEIVIKKEDNAGHALPGAEFALLSLDTSSPTLVSTLKIGEIIHADGVISMEDVSEITVSNLASGNYRLVETHAPDGYVILTRGIDFSVDANSGAVTLVKESTETVEGKTEIIYIPAEASDYTDASARENVIIVKNTPGAALPNTGGPGTTALYLLGIMLTGIAGAGLVMRKRRRI